MLDQGYMCAQHAYRDRPPESQLSDSADQPAHTVEGNLPPQNKSLSSIMAGAGHAAPQSRLGKKVQTDGINPATPLV